MGVDTEQRFTFDAVAELYDRHRPGYPDALFEDLAELAGLAPDARVLEIGCGTGQATRALARRGHAIVCLEPGPKLAALARANLRDYPRVRVVCESFERWPPERAAFDLVVSAQAFHWIAPELRFTRSAEVLRPGGALAVIGNTTVSAASPLGSALDAAYVQHAPALLGPPPTRWYAAEGPLVQLFEDSGVFGSVEVRRHPWARRLSAGDYVGLMRTHSNHNLLPERRREALHAALAEAIHAHGGFVDERYEANLYVARLLR